MGWPELMQKLMVQELEMNGIDAVANGARAPFSRRDEMGLIDAVVDGARFQTL